MSNTRCCSRKEGPSVHCTVCVQSIHSMRLCSCNCGKGLDLIHPHTNLAFHKSLNKGVLTNCTSKVSSALCCDVQTSIFEGLYGFIVFVLFGDDPRLFRVWIVSIGWPFSEECIPP